MTDFNSKIIWWPHPFFSPNTFENTVVSFLMISWKLPARLIPN
ncbi:unnamed protein product [Acanthoscelides obtectus]|uniref:Uncharacterized protein n=1 Tax=Acanthoscelides obtectus TaxID=200917 RepID=A0A9P0PW82_ACAOB|nr:unnamed protein product [Acanthoscelides obtectus]CAK1659548.1 hypothetical protein AOBTE_LOCUS21526 [Acanthoscelides obtectus]